MSKYIVDYGGNRRGNYAVSRKKADIWVCSSPACGSHQYEPFRARYRRTRLRCHKCGALCILKEKKHRIPKIKVRKCKKCKTPLRTGNPLDVCNACFNGMTYGQRQRAMGIR